MLVMVSSPVTRDVKSRKVGEVCKRGLALKKLVSLNRI
jgi:hypothetical protein